MKNKIAELAKEIRIFVQTTSSVGNEKNSKYLYLKECSI